MPGGEAFAGSPGEHRLAQFDGAELAVTGRLAQLVEQIAQGAQQDFAAVAPLQGRAGRAAQQAVDGGQANRGHAGASERLTFDSVGKPTRRAISDV
ncbi:hypothetical protein D9M68_484700 [compost metagenome]